MNLVFGVFYDLKVAASEIYDNFNKPKKLIKCASLGPYDVVQPDQMIKTQQVIDKINRLIPILQNVQERRDFAELKSISVLLVSNDAQIERMLFIFIRIFCTLQNDEEQRLKNEIFDLISMDSEHITKLLEYTHYNSSDREMVSRCLELLRLQTGVEFDFREQGIITLKLGLQSQSKDFDLWRSCLPSFKRLFPNCEIHLDITPNSRIESRALIDFFEYHRSMVHSLDLTHIDIDEQLLQYLLWNTLGLRHLFIRSNRIEGDGIGLQELRRLVDLKTLDLSCLNMRSPPDLVGQKRLKILRLNNCSSMAMVPDLRKCYSLEVLEMKRCSLLKTPPDLFLTRKLVKLDLSFCVAMKEPPNLSQCTKSLRELYIYGCRAMEEAPELHDCLELQSFRVEIDQGHIRRIYPLDASKVHHSKLMECRGFLSDFLISLVDLQRSQNKFIPDFYMKPFLNERIIAFANIMYYLEHLEQFPHPDLEFRIEVFKQLLLHANPNASKNALRLGICSDSISRTVLLSDPDIKHFIEELQLPDDFAPYKVMARYMIYRVIINNDFVRFETMISKSDHEWLAPFAREEGFKSFFRRHRHQIFDTPSLKKLCIALYPPNKENNSFFYPLIYCVSNRIIKIKMGLHAPLERPAELLSLIECALTRESVIADLPNRFQIEYFEELGIDAGGLGKQFISGLFMGLIVNRHGQSEIKFRRRRNGFYLPVQKQSGHGLYLGTEEMDSFIRLGKLLIFLFTSPVNYPIGQFFETKFFELLLGMKPDEVKMPLLSYQKKLADLDLEDFLRLCEPVIDYDEETNEQIELARCLASVKNYEELAEPAKARLFQLFYIDADNFSETRHSVEEMLMEKYLSTFAAIQAIAKGMSTCFPITLERHDYVLIPGWEQFTMTSSWAFAVEIQGEFSKDQFKEELKILAANSAKSAEVRRWFENWIDRTDDELVCGLIQHLTGSRALVDEINVYVDRGRDVISVATCFNNLHIPWDMEERLFYDQLDEMSAAGVCAGFGGG